MQTFNEQLARDGMLLAAEGLKPTAAGATIEFGGKEPSVKRGASGSTDFVAGYWVIQAPSLDAAIATMKKAPIAQGRIEVRPIEGDELFAAMPDLVKREKALREQIAHRRPS